jgi:16S rRNA (uracil1498-N3)-methyltransferase
MRAEWPRRVGALAQFRVATLDAPVLSADDDRHLRKVLRARDGEEVVLTNGRGAWSLARVNAGGLEATGLVGQDDELAPCVLYMAPVKGDRSEWAVAKATELGVTTIVPLITERLAIKFSGEARHKVLRRWTRIALEAAGQCRRTHDLTIADPQSLTEVPADVPACDFGGGGDWSSVRAVIVGPEGGFGPGELGERPRLSLGPSVLRAETAAVMAAGLMAFGAGGWGFTVASRLNG